VVVGKTIVAVVYNPDSDRLALRLIVSAQSSSPHNLSLTQVRCFVSVIGGPVSTGLF